MEINRVSPVTNRQLPLDQPDSKERSKEEKQADREQDMVAKQPATEKDMARAVEGLNKMFESAHTHIQFTYHEELGKYYVQIIDENDEVIKEIPSKKILDMVTEMGKALGLIFDRKV
ncbi:hypothetical protein BEP19_07545 [Ammoniphilus oxalaticus]|uniref:Flagellar biosynthesis protein FlaG n=1 Tax=Ammoniphilus oxalaticus TaxID=66863 RepID=A0A419SJY9_9BACL|nr:flagellar protein FlaG [Ammoniphilus oxalaticus]RKD24249.1 hypothetical protein BEP19_07545 [Ammoniphilus oxalaticus]